MRGLKACPFCGHKGEVEQEEQLFETSEEWYRVICEACGGSAGWYQSQQEAIAAWNNRT